MAILTPNPSRLMESLRDTGYSFNTAMADIVDNSIAAGATTVNVKIEMDHENLLHIYIADDGCGMDKNGLLNAMRYGSDERKNAASLGKFGMGLKTASTAFCRCLSVISKSDTSKYEKVQWDLDYVCETQQWELKELAADDDEIDFLEETTNGNSGTLVEWDKIDRLMKEYSNDANRKKAFNKLIDDLKFHFSMTYQRFLDNTFTDVGNVRILINGDELSPWDPFCREEPNRKCLSQKPLKISVDGEIVPCVLEAWLLPRDVNFSSEDAYKNARIRNDNEGFYVYRENRLIHWGDWLGTYINDPHYSLLRINLSFDYRFDEAFNIDIKKSRILLDESIFSYFKEKYLPALRREADDEYRHIIRSETKKKDESVHEESNKKIDDKASNVENSKVQKVEKKTDGTNVVTINNPMGGFKTTEISIVEDEECSEARILPVDDLPEGVLWKPTLINGNHAVSINRNHEFYSKVYYPAFSQGSVVRGMDSLLWALVEAEYSTCNENAKQQFTELRYSVSKILRELLQDLPEPNVLEK